jgi:hypothetical protein
VAQQPVVGVLEHRLGGFGPEFQEGEWNDDQRELDEDEDDDGGDLGRGGRLAGASRPSSSAIGVSCPPA